MNRPKAQQSRDGEVIGGAFFLLPLLGLIAPRAWEQDPSTIGITLESDANQPAQTR